MGNFHLESPVGGVFAVRIMKELSIQQIANAFHDTFTPLSLLPSLPQVACSNYFWHGEAFTLKICLKRSQDEKEGGREKGGKKEGRRGREAGRERKKGKDDSNFYLWVLRSNPEIEHFYFFVIFIFFYLQG